MSNIRDQIEESVRIYLQLTKTASASGDQELASTMCAAAYERFKASPKLFSALFLADLAEALLLLGRADKAEEAFNQALESQRQSGRKNFWLSARICDGLTAVYLKRCDAANALKSSRLTVKMMRRTANIDKSLMASRLKQLAYLTAQNGEILTAAKLRDEALNLSSNTPAPLLTPTSIATLPQSAILSNP